MVEEKVSFVEKLCENTILCYKTSGIIAAIIACIVICALAVGTFIGYAYNIAMTLPAWVQCSIVVFMIPFVIAVFKTILEIPPAAPGGDIFEVEIQKTAHDYSWVFLRVNHGWGNIENIATKTPKNADAKNVAISLMANAQEIYNNYKSKPSGTITRVVDNDDYLSNKINRLEKELDRVKKENKILTELERKNKRNDKRDEL